MVKDENVQTILREQIKQHLILNPVERGKPGCYQSTAEAFGVDTEYVRDIYRKLRKKGLITDDSPVENFDNRQAADNRYFKEDVQRGTADVTTVVTNRRIVTLEDVLEACEVDKNIWDVITYEVNKWEVGRKNKTVDLNWKDGVATGSVSDKGTIFVEPLIQVKAKLGRRKISTDLKLQKEAIMAELAAYKPSSDIMNFVKDIHQASKEFNNEKKNCILEINIPDLHIGKLAWGEETGDDYDIKIAIKRYKDAVKELISRTNIHEIGQILLVFGHDLLNVNGRNNMTTAGTPQSSDSRFYKMVKVAQQLGIETIDELSTIAPVDVMIIPGNHDSDATLLLGDILKAWYKDDLMVRVFNDASPRKYYQYGKNLLMFCHGHNEKLDQLGQICATEKPELWAATKFRRAHVGHWHHSKQIRFTDVQEFPGFTVKIINSLSSNDAWHAERGYLSLKGAEAFLYHKDKGLQANYYYYQS